LDEVDESATGSLTSFLSGPFGAALVFSHRCAFLLENARAGPGCAAPAMSVAATGLEPAFKQVAVDVPRDLFSGGVVVSCNLLSSRLQSFATPDHSNDCNQAEAWLL